MISAAREAARPLLYGAAEVTIMQTFEAQLSEPFEEEEEDWAGVLERIVEDPEARRELLWVRAMEKGDVEDARSLARLDPGILARLGETDDVYAVLDGANERERIDRFGDLWHATWHRHARRILGEAD